ncbi:sensor histidine kinase [Desulfosporosinus lacus]|uniref:histidine kinase n=1 Tax=Desulfosporosinus lacus DSM 15449 TaxID=1121420 RepID=A0A1M5ZBD9_9FIRM|nr:sensor histidine kinase [Desulfosporosinus lacus]SHI21541.1 Signal transduction histidine kinase [Desulfosporosinus lacus DSM 15449]
MIESIYGFLLAFCFAGLLVALCFVFYSKKAIKRDLWKVTEDLSRILDENTAEKIMVFTDEKSIMELITQANRMLEDRQKAKTDYRKSEFASKRMLSNISHDLKTPLTVILGYLEIMLMRPSNETESLKKVENKAHQVMELINKFFTLAKLEAGDTDIPITRININEICKKNILDFYDILTNRDFLVELNIPEINIYVQGNEDALDRILFNLISNAVRYGYEGKYLGMTLRFDNNYSYIDIIDKGKGIEEKSTALVFDRLYTLEDSRNKEIQGNGLGLTIAKRLAEKLGGEIMLKSQPFIETVFTVKLKKMNY